MTRGPRIVDVCLTLFFLITAMIAVWQVQDFPFQDQLYPYTASALILLCVVIYASHQIISGPIAMDVDESGNSPKQPFTRQQFPTVLPLIVAT